VSRIRTSLSIARASAVVFVETPSWPSRARPKATSRAHHHYSANLLIARGHCFTVLNFSFAMRVSGQVTPIFVLPVEMPAPCHVRLGGPTSNLCESFAVCRTRLSLPYILRSTLVLPTGDEQAKYQSANTATRLVLMRRRHSHQEMSPRLSREPGIVSMCAL
jgi:hypothetical protein